MIVVAQFAATLTEDSGAPLLLVEGGSSLGLRCAGANAFATLCYTYNSLRVAQRCADVQAVKPLCASEGHRRATCHR